MNIPQVGIVDLGVWPTNQNLIYRFNDGVLEYRSKHGSLWNVGTCPGPQNKWNHFVGFTEWVEARLIALGMNDPPPPPVPPTELIAKYKTAITLTLEALADRALATKILEEALA